MERAEISLLEKARAFNSSHWNELMTELKISDEVGSLWWTIIDEHYHETRRYYHNHCHISDMIEEMYQIIEDVEDPSLLLLSIFFHDVVYDPHSPFNEENSADLFRRFAESIELADNSCRSVLEAILATKSHSPGGSPSNDLLLLLDLDVSILGSSRDKYVKYASDIRKEYHFVPLDEFCKKRAEIIGNFLAQESLYLSDKFKKKYEISARTNISEEIKRLNRLEIPSYCESGNPND